MYQTFRAFFSNAKVERSFSRAQSLADQFNREGSRHHIDEAIALDREALALCPSNHPMRARSLGLLSIHLSDRYNQFGDTRDIEEGIVLARAALQLRPSGHPDRDISLSNLAHYLSTRYHQLGALEDLDEAISLERHALALCPPGHESRCTSLHNLAAYIHSRYGKLGAIEDLDDSISLHRDSLALYPPGHPDYSMALSNLATYLHTRYAKLGAIEDLDEAVSLNRDALKFSPPGHPDRSLSLNNLARHLHSRYEKLGTIDDLDEAVQLDRDALKLRPLGHPDRSLSLNDLSVDLHTRHKRLRKKEDLDEAIALDRAALVLRPPGHPERSESLHNHSVHLHSRYEKLGIIDILDEVILLDNEALGLRPLGHPGRSQSLKNLANHLLAQFTRTSLSQDKDGLFNVYAQLVDISHTVSSMDLSAANEWISVAEDFKHSTTVLAYETYLRLLIHHLAALPSLPRHLNLVKDLTSSLALDAFSAALRNHLLTKAVELLEQGRGVFLSQLARLRSPVDDVIASGPDGKTLGDRFLQLTSLIRNALESPGAHQHDRVCHLNMELQRVVSNIRGLPSFSHFLLPPLFSYLRKAAIGGPVAIVNASKYGCDALVVFFDRDPIHIPLPVTRDEVRGMTSELQRLTKHTKRTDMGKHFAAIMRALWEKVVSRIVDILKTNHPLQSRVWWCPTAEFSVLPLHAAGTYRKGQPKFSDLYISSYTSSLTALIHTRQHQLPNSGGEAKRFVAIGQTNVAGESELHSIGDELTKISERVGGRAIFNRMEGSESRVKAVMEALAQNEWVHLACHGLPNRKQPFESAFGLYDGKLMVERLLHCDLQSAEFAYLSACHTTVGDEDCLDEMIHLASAMQFAGFRSVIGTMWAVDDEQTVKITSKFYEKMIDESGRLDHTRAAYALHQTMSELSGLSFDQRILYVHFGA